LKRLVTDDGVNWFANACETIQDRFISWTSVEDSLPNRQKKPLPAAGRDVSVLSVFGEPEKNDLIANLFVSPKNILSTIPRFL
jgi:uncharacterized membrane protein